MRVVILCLNDVDILSLSVMSQYVCTYLNNANNTTITIVYKNRSVKAVSHTAHLEIDRVCEKNNTWQ